ncbi:MAG: carboxylating nicotinate-nucleotide diphosphorylase [Solirubrobacterales bacterium]|nr:carboxylating nicotinate-nucleotide diphosphorylase [Solirubrobacterales bacterium]
MPPPADPEGAPAARRNQTVADLVARALAEDVGEGDATSAALIDARARARARISLKQPGVVFGLEPARQAFAQAGADGFEARVAEGEWRESVPGEVALIEGPARAVLTAERTALNFLCHLSGVATLTARFVAAVRGTGVEILDTRKTIPGLRALEKAAVVAGGGTNHRFGLDDAILIKENHIAVAGGLGRAVAAARAARPELSVEVECRTLAEVAEALEAGATRLLLDNMSPDEMRRAVATRDRAGSAAALEASGGVSLTTVAEIAGSGVDLISVGALTHSAPALDLSLLVEPA